MKYLYLLLFLLISFRSGYSASRPDIDTVSVMGLTTGLDGKLVRAHVQSKLDTLLWDDNSGIGIVKFSGDYLNLKGEFRIAYSQGLVSQVSFVAPTKSLEDSKTKFESLSQQLISMYGPADVASSGNGQSSDAAVMETRWEGMKQSISVKAVVGANYVTVALSKFGM
ncbi:MAG: hypothetical protein Q8916_01800 [Bacteroidota bacterium]|nr:hypothetical protein [Bacteroidota bacterium]MDP4229121.1 hypothetical protein [Bacteroidota bacterium]MDP4235611.1 hypothetical protein [Bacteroidota bacterium]